MDLKEEGLLGDAVATHWYYQSKAQALAACLPKGEELRILDVGAGSGFFSRWLLERGLATEATCVDTGYTEDRDETVQGRPLAFRKSIEASDANIVLMMDVLEHVADDVGLLASYLDKLPASATVLITVPAFQFLWSAHDVFLEHYRRYTVASLAKTVRTAGAVPTHLHYYFGAIFPLAVAVRMTRRAGAADRSDMTPQTARGQRHPARDLRHREAHHADEQARRPVGLLCLPQATGRKRRVRRWGEATHVS